MVGGFVSDFGRDGQMQINGVTIASCVSGADHGWIERIFVRKGDVLSFTNFSLPKIYNYSANLNWPRLPGESSGYPLIFFYAK